MKELRGRPAGAGVRISVVVSRFNEAITTALLEGALDCLRDHGVDGDAIEVVHVPGAWELAVAAKRAADAGADAVLALGCIIRGETPHFDIIAAETARGLGSVALETGVPVAFGVLTTENPEQAWARAGGRDTNKGREAALAALEMADLLRETRS